MNEFQYNYIKKAIEEALIWNEFKKDIEDSGGDFFFMDVEEGINTKYYNKYDLITRELIWETEIDKYIYDNLDDFIELVKKYMEEGIPEIIWEADDIFNLYPEITCRYDLMDLD